MRTLVRWSNLDLLLLLGYIVGLPWMDFPRLPQKLILADLLFLVLAPVAVGLALYRRRPVGPWLYYLVLAGYAGAAALSALTSDEPSVSMRALPKVLYLMGLAAVCRIVLFDRERLKLAIGAVLVAGAEAAGSALLGAFSFYLGWSELAGNPLLSHYGSMPPGNYPRVNGLFSNANLLCNFLIIPVSLAALLGLRKLVAFLVSGAFFTFSPGLGAIALVLSRRPWAVAIALFILVINLFSAAALVQGKLLPSARVICWKEGLRTFKRQPVLGKGLGVTTVMVPNVLPSGARQLLLDPHNSFVSVAAQMGLAGLTSFVALLGFMLWGNRDPTSRVLAMALAGCWLYQGLTGSLEDSRHAWLLIGMLEASRRLPLAPDDALEANPGG